MNRLKYILGINVPRRLAPTIQQRPKELCKKQHSEARLMKSARFLVSRARKSYDFKGLHYGGHQQRGRPKSSLAPSSRTSLERRIPAESIQTRRISSNQLAKSCNSKRRVARSNEKAIDAKNSKMYGTSVAEHVIEKEPRSYAQMIKSFSEAMYPEPESGTLKDDVLRPSLPNGSRRNPVSTVSAKCKTRPKAGKNVCFRSTVCNQGAKFSGEPFAMRHDSRSIDKDFVGPIAANDEFERTSSSYATMIEKYSHANSRSWTNSLVPRRNVCTREKIDDTMFLLDAKEVGDKSKDVEEGSNRKTVHNKLVEAEEDKTDTQKPVGWITQVEDVIKDLQRITDTKKLADDANKSNERLMLQSVKEHADWLDRVVNAHKRKIRHGKSEKTVARSNANDTTGATESEWKEDPTFESKGDHSIGQALEMSAAGDKPSNPISQYIKRGPTSSKTPGSTQRGASQTPTTTATTSPAKEPQIELRMTPTQNESVVSINVDELAGKTAGTGNQEQLSVVISSQRNNAGKVDASNMNLHSDFGSMQISISENTVPVKQIEFSINGKPVSELKSIVARADKLDVLSSMDKVEIRIPSTKNAAKAFNQQTRTVAGSATKPVLNLQIAAKFNEPRAQQPRDAGIRTETAAKKTPPPPPPKPPSQNFLKPDGTRYEPSKSVNENTKNVTSPNVTVRKPEDAARPEHVDPPRGNNARDSIPRAHAVRHVEDGASSTAKTDEAVFQRSTAETPPANPASQPSTNSDNPNSEESSKGRAPSTTIPWWSSEGSFKKIRKKKNDPKNASAVDNEATESKEVQESAGVTQKVEQASNPDAMSNQQSAIDTLKSVTPGKSVVVKKTVVDENETTSDLPDSVLRVIRVQSPQKWVTFKPSSGTRSSKRKGASISARLGKKSKYRVKSIPAPAKTSNDAKEELEKPVQASQLPKVVKDVPNPPQRADMNEEPKAAKTPPMSEDQQRPAAKTEASKKFEKATGAQASPSQTGKEIVQHRKTVLKEAKDLEKPANRSADVSAKTTPSATDFHVEVAKGKGQNEADGREPREKRDTVDKVSGEKIEEILKSMKPIEKRKDGTLIDYGVTVPSRKPSETFRKLSRIRSKMPINVEPKNVVTESATKPKSIPSQVKIVEPEKPSPSKTQAKTTSLPDKIVEPEKISSTKRTVEATNLESDKSKTQPEKAASKKDAKKQPDGDGKPPTDTGSVLKIEKSNPLESRKNAASVRLSNTKMATVEKKEETIMKQESSVKKHEADNPKIPKSISFDAPKNIPYERNVTPSWLQVPEKKEPNQKSEKSRKAPFEGTIVAPPSTTTKKMYSSQKLSGTDTYRVKSTVSLERKLRSTGVAPFEGTINQSRKKQDGPTAFPSVNKERRANSAVLGERCRDLPPRSKARKSSSAKSGGRTLGGSVNTITGPAGFETPVPRPTSTTQNSLKDKPTTAVDHSNKGRKPDARKENESTSLPSNDEPHDAILLFENTAERPEKNMLYNVWLQRFDSGFDDGKII